MALWMIGIVLAPIEYNGSVFNSGFPSVSLTLLPVKVIYPYNGLIDGSTPNVIVRILSFVAQLTPLPN